MNFSFFIKRILVVVTAFALVICVFFVSASNSMFNKPQKTQSPPPLQIDLLKHVDVIAINRLPAGFYRVTKTLMSTLSETGISRIFVEVKVIKGLRSDHIKDDSGAVLKIYWLQELKQGEEVDYAPGDVIERPAGKPFEAICHPKLK